MVKTNFHYFFVIKITDGCSQMSQYFYSKRAHCTLTSLSMTRSITVFVMLFC